VIVPDGVIRPIMLVPLSTNQTLPSGPAVMPNRFAGCRQASTERYTRRSRIVHRSSVRCLPRDARPVGYAVARGCRENRGTRLFRKRAAHIYDDLSLTGETTDQHQGSTASNSNRR